MKKLWKMKSLTQSEGSVITFMLVLNNFFPLLRKQKNIELNMVRVFPVFAFMDICFHP